MVLGLLHVGKSLFWCDFLKIIFIIFCPTLNEVQGRPRIRFAGSLFVPLSLSLVVCVNSKTCDWSMVRIKVISDHTRICPE